MKQNIAILGNSHGDCGKARVVHQLSSDFDWVIRFNGGSNAGHTIYRNGKKYVHHLLPSIDWPNSKAKAYLSSGTLISLPELIQEIEEVSKEFDLTHRIYVDPLANLVFPHHKELDAANGKEIGTTKKGIGPAALDKYSRKTGFKIQDHLNSASEMGSLLHKLQNLGVKFQSCYSLLPTFKNSRCLFEGAQGALLDINHGTYPYVTIGDTTLSGIGAAGFNSLLSDTKVIGISKGYITRVGAGPLPTAIENEQAGILRNLGEEFGATTGRARDTAWLDLPALAYSCDMAGIQEVILTKLDVLSKIPSIKVCNRYKNKERISSYRDFFNAEPEYITFPSWESDQDPKFWEYVNYVNNYLVENTLSKVKIIAYTTGVNPEDMSYLDDISI